MPKPNLVSLDFSDIKQSLKDYFKQQSEFTDYNFDSSGLSILLNALALDAEQTAYLANMIANEADIDSAILRENVVSRAKGIGYTSKSKKAAKAVIQVNITDPDNEASSLLMPRGTRFITSSGGSMYSFTTLKDHNLYLNEDSGVYESGDVEIFEGTVKAVSWKKDEGMRFVINSMKIDTDTLKVAVFESYNDASSGVAYQRATSLEKVTPSSNVFWVQEVDGARYELLFGDGVFGTAPVNTNVVYAEYLDTNGPIANGFKQFTLAGTFAGYETSEIQILTVDQSGGGADQESTESIKFKAPRARIASGKAVGYQDVQSLAYEFYPYAQDVASWGGEDERPVKYGKVYLCIIPKDGTKITEYSKNEIIRKIRSRGVAGITPVIVDPDFIRFNLTAKVSVKANNVAQYREFSNEVKTLIIDFFESKFYSFNSNFYYSNLATEIENFSRSVQSVRLDYELSIVDSIERTTFDFKNEIAPGTVRSSRVYTTTTGNTASLKDIDGIVYHEDSPVGTVDYKTGIISLNGLLLSSDNQLEIFISPVEDDIMVTNRTVIVLDKERLAVELKAWSK